MTSPKSNPLEVIRARLRKAAQDSGMTQEEIGIAMGFSKSGARQAVSRLLSSESNLDPRLTTLIEFAAAIKCPLTELLRI